MISYQKKGSPCTDPQSDRIHVCLLLSCQDCRNCCQNNDVHSSSQYIRYIYLLFRRSYRFSVHFFLMPRYCRTELFFTNEEIIFGKYGSKFFIHTLFRCRCLFGIVFLKPRTCTHIIRLEPHIEMLSHSFHDYRVRFFK